MNKTSMIPYSVPRKSSDSISEITPDYGVDNLLVGNRVWCLYRVSTNQQVDHDEKNEADIPMQRKACHRFAKKMGWTIIHEEQEEGVSGHKVRAENRDKLQIIKEAAKQKKFDILLVFMFDRIGRIADETPFPQTAPWPCPGSPAAVPPAALISAPSHHLIRSIALD